MATTPTTAAPIVMTVGFTPPKKLANTERSIATCHAVKATAAMEITRQRPNPVQSDFGVMGMTVTGAGAFRQGRRPLGAPAAEAGYRLRSPGSRSQDTQGKVAAPDVRESTYCAWPSLH